MSRLSTALLSFGVQWNAIVLAGKISGVVPHGVNSSLHASVKQLHGKNVVHGSLIGTGTGLLSSLLHRLL